MRYLPQIVCIFTQFIRVNFKIKYTRTNNYDYTLVKNFYKIQSQKSLCVIILLLLLLIIVKNPAPRAQGVKVKIKNNSVMSSSGLTGESSLYSGLPDQVGQ
jgi:hypothetical protein